MHHAAGVAGAWSTASAPAHAAAKRGVLIDGLTRHPPAAFVCAERYPPPPGQPPPPPPQGGGRHLDKIAWDIPGYTANTKKIFFRPYWNCYHCVVQRATSLHDRPPPPPNPMRVQLAIRLFTGSQFSYLSLPGSGKGSGPGGSGLIAGSC